MLPLQITLGAIVGLYASPSHAQMLMEKIDLKPCKNITITSLQTIDLTKAEQDLICGDPSNPGWKSIPDKQAIYFIKIFLGARGYWQPVIETNGGRIDIDTGVVLSMKSLEIVNSPIPIDVESYWYPRGKPLTPDLLDTIEGWVKRTLSKNGYPCSATTAVASQATGDVRITVEAGKLWNVSSIKTEGVPGLLGGVERRYDAFNIDDIYNSEKFELTSQRIVANDLAVNSSFSPMCTPEKDHNKVSHALTAGPPRMLSFGFGFDTEEYFVAQVMWKNGRLFSTGSPLQTQASVSYITQKVGVSWNWYYLPFASRHYLNLNSSASRTNERRYEELATKIAALPSWENDIANVFYKFAVGPSFETIETKRGLGKDRFNLLFWESHVQMHTHPFEYYQSSPRDGHAVSLSHRAANVDFGSNVSTNMWNAQSTHLWNLAHFDPPIFILGLRTAFASTSAGKKTKPEDLPPSFRHHLGGVENLRGFGRNSLPNTDEGALTSAYAGTELRLNNILPYKLQPFVFADTAMLGDEYLMVDRKTQYWSPGAGMRWESPVGSMRFSLAHGLIDGEKKSELKHQQRWQFYFSFGDQF